MKIFTIDVHHYIHHHDSQGDADLRRIEKLLVTLGERIMTNLSDLASDVATIKQDVATVATAVADEVADLRAQLATAIANQDPAALQAVHDGLGEVHTSLTAIAAANSPAPAPTPDPAPVDAPAP
jgi:hypothetical protein